MNPIRVKAIGARTSLSQIYRIEEGFAAAGAELVAWDEADLVYSNDGGTHQEAITYRDTFAPKAKLILNNLDIAEHLLGAGLDHTHLAALRDNLLKADAVTSISPFTQSQLMRYLNIGSYCVWNPVKTVSPAKRLAGERPYPYRVLISGRTMDPNKRIRTLAIPALVMCGLEEREVAVIGGEWPGWGTNLGVVSDEKLNDLLNSVDLVMGTTLCGGLELGPIEAAICGAIPILTWDTSTFHDLRWPQHWGCYPSPAAIAYRIRTLLSNPSILAADREHALTMGEHFSEDLSGASVARRILEVYKRTLSP